MTADLITRIEAGTGADRALDGEIWCAVWLLEFVKWDGAGCVYRDRQGPVWDRGIKHKAAGEIPPYTGSMDAAMALTDQQLPEAHGWQFTIYHDGACVSGIAPPRVAWGKSKSRPRSLLAATLRAHAALKAKETSDADT